jgi:hypothetical protein
MDTADMSVVQYNPQAPAFVPGGHYLQPVNPTLQTPIFFAPVPIYLAPPNGQSGAQPVAPPAAQPASQSYPLIPMYNPVHQHTQPHQANNFVVGGERVYSGRSRARVKEDNQAEEVRGAVARHIAAENATPDGAPNQMFEVWDYDGRRNYYPLAVIKSWGKEAGRWYWNTDHSEAHFERRI